MEPAAGAGPSRAVGRSGARQVPAVHGRCQASTQGVAVARVGRHGGVAHQHHARPWVWLRRGWCVLRGGRSSRAQGESRDQQGRQGARAPHPHSPAVSCRYSCPLIVQDPLCVYQGCISPAPGACAEPALRITVASGCQPRAWTATSAHAATQRSWRQTQPFAGPRPSLGAAGPAAHR